MTIGTVRLFFVAVVVICLLASTRVFSPHVDAPSSNGPSDDTKDAKFSRSSLMMARPMLDDRPRQQQQASSCINGELLLGVCFCDPGYIGADCARTDPTQQPPPCNDTSDACFVHHMYGVCKVSHERWKRAQAAEQKLWKVWSEGADDRSKDHLSGYSNYSSVPRYLGHVLEVGCGPWTQLGFMLDQRSTWTVDQITLWEPGAAAYMRDVKSCAYKDGKLRGHPVSIVSKGAEEIDAISTYDTIMMTNVLEHVENIYVILERIYAALKPGGVLIFSDRWHDTYDQSTPVARPGSAVQLVDTLYTNPSQDHLYHPIRCSRRVFEHFLQHFVPWYKAVDHPDMIKYSVPGKHGVYFIGMKPLLPGKPVDSR